MYEAQHIQKRFVSGRRSTSKNRSFFREAHWVHKKKRVQEEVCLKKTQQFYAVKQVQEDEQVKEAQQVREMQQI